VSEDSPDKMEYSRRSRARACLRASKRGNFVGNQRFLKRYVGRKTKGDKHYLTSIVGILLCFFRSTVFILLLLLLLLLEYVYPTEQVQLRDRRIAREKKYIQITLPKDVKRMLMYVIIFAHGI
jgi:hypothetical protein